MKNIKEYLFNIVYFKSLYSIPMDTLMFSLCSTASYVTSGLRQVNDTLTPYVVLVIYYSSANVFVSMQVSHHVC